MKKIILLLAGLVFITFNNQAQTVTDYDGNVYNTVTIGTQEWMKENLKVTHYRNGDSIPNVKGGKWYNLTTGAYCDFNNSPDTSITYGRLYNFFAVFDSSSIHYLCPTGWHVPSDTEWTVLTTYLGGNAVAARNLKESGTTHWTSPNDANNLTGFTALPSGYRHSDARFLYFGVNTLWWTSTAKNSTLSWTRFVYNTSSSVTILDRIKTNGFSVRCLKDPPTQINQINIQEKIDIYPNPATDKIYIVCASRQELKIQVYNTVGKCVMQKELKNTTNEIDISSFTRGIYILKFTSSNGTLEKKLIKE